MENDNNVKFKLYDILNKLRKNNTDINDNLTKKSGVNDNLNLLFLELKKYKNDLRRRFISLMLSVVITLGSGIGVFYLSKKISSNRHYAQHITTYSNFKGVKNNKRFIKDYEDENNKIYINIYDSWYETDNGYERKIYKYDVSSYKFDDIKKYLEYDIDFYNVDCEIYIDKVSNNNLSKLYNKNFIEVESSYVDCSEVKEFVDPVSFMAVLPSLYCLYLFVLYGALYFSDYKYIFGQCSSIFDCFEKIRDNKKITREQIKIISDINKNIMILVNSNELIKKEFSKLYEENKFLLNNPDELYEKFNILSDQIDVDNVKKLVMKKA